MLSKRKKNSEVSCGTLEWHTDGGYILVATAKPTVCYTVLTHNNFSFFNHNFKKIEKTPHHVSVGVYLR